MKLPRRQFLHLATGAVALSAVPRFARAQTYPSRPITMIVPFPPGGSIDVVGRVVAERMRQSLGQPLTIQNVSGAEGTIAVGRAARARPDGYTLVVGGMSTHVLNGGLYSLPYDLLNDFAPISSLAIIPQVLFARKTMAAADVKELITWLRANPNQASAGIGSATNHLLTTLFQKEIGTQFTLVPYRGNAPARQDLLAGRIDLFFDNPDQFPLMRVGSIKAYAVTSDARWTVVPDVPTFAKMGIPALAYSSWTGLFAPKGTPKDILGKLNAAAVEATADTAVRLRLGELGYEILPREQQTPQALAALQKADAEKWWPIIKELGLKGE
jgi:tripartite-type tricarboxylate transporter receptor subunit TctC